MLRDCRVMPYTLVAFHAHPDDEALLTSGTMARAAAEGHRVVLVVATDGELGLASTDFTAGGGLAAHRRAELEASAAVLGVARTEWLGYADSGSGEELLPDPPGAPGSCGRRSRRPPSGSPASSARSRPRCC